MNTNMNGRMVKHIAFSNGEMISPREGIKLKLSATHHGDHDEFWVVEFDNDKEVSRHNCKHLETITWSDTDV